MAVRQVFYEPEYDVVPQAIFWRALKCFTMLIREGADGLGLFEAASFEIGNDIKFDLRSYSGHPKFTVTLYLPGDIVEEGQISEIIKIVIDEMIIARSALTWQRGQDFEYGKLERVPTDRLREEEARILVLKIAATQPDFVASVDFIKKEVPTYIELSPDDKKRSETRKNELLWQQIVRNVTSSHQTGKRGLFGQGFAEKIPRGIKLTERGIAYLKSLGFSVPTFSSLENRAL
jgi:hypothetical protein